MDTNKLLGQNKSAVTIIILVVIFLLPIGYSVFSYVLNQKADESTPFLERPDAQYENCVKDTDYMRFHHWELLRGIREEIVRYGKRGDINLNKCRECHTSRENFCNKCHDAVSLTPDCFGCHYYP